MAETHKQSTHQEDIHYLRKAAGWMGSQVFSVAVVLAGMGIFNEFHIYFKTVVITYLALFNWKLLLALSFASIVLRLAIKKAVASHKRRKEVEKAPASFEVEDIISNYSEEKKRYLKKLDIYTKKFINNLKKTIPEKMSALGPTGQFNSTMCTPFTANGDKELAARVNEICRDKGVVVELSHDNTCFIVSYNFTGHV